MCFHPVSGNGPKTDRVPESQKDGACVRIQCIDMTDTVLLLIRPGQFMLFDDIIFIIVNRCAADEAGLRPAIHDLPVNIIDRRALPDIYAFSEHPLQVLGGFLIDSPVVDPYGRVEIDLSSVHMQKRPRMTLYHFAGFRTAHDVIRKRGNFTHIFFRRSYGSERSENSHFLSFLIQERTGVPLFAFLSIPKSREFCFRD